MPTFEPRVNEMAAVRITVNGRPVADLSPIRQRARFVGADVLDRLHALPADPAWSEDLADLRADEPEDPWSRARPA